MISAKPAKPRASGNEQCTHALDSRVDMVYTFRKDIVALARDSEAQQRLHVLSL